MARGSWSSVRERMRREIRRWTGVNGEDRMIDTETRSGPKIKGTESCAESEIVLGVSQAFLPLRHPQFKAPQWESLAVEFLSESRTF
jgi:hypothetical protein